MLHRGHQAQRLTQGMPRILALLACEASTVLHCFEPLSIVPECQGAEHTQQGVSCEIGVAMTCLRLVVILAPFLKVQDAAPVLTLCGAG